MKRLRGLIASNRQGRQTAFWTSGVVDVSVAQWCLIKYCPYHCSDMTPVHSNFTYTDDYYTSQKARGDLECVFIERQV